MEQEESTVGCMSILHPFQPPPKRLIRTIKPPAGSSFNVRAQLIPHMDTCAPVMCMK